MLDANTILPLLAAGLMLVLLIILLRRKLQGRFPVFLAYCVCTLIVFAVRFLTVRRPTLFFLVYWSTEAGYLVIAFFTMLSVLRPLTQFEYALHPWSRFVFIPFLALLAGACLWTALLRPINTTHAGRFASAVYVFVILMCLAELVLFLLSYRVRGRYPVKWTWYEFGILAGFGVLAFLNLIAYSALVLRLLHFKVAPELESLFQSFPPGAFMASATVWLIAFWKPEPPRPQVTPDLGSLEDALREFEEQIALVKAVSKWLHLKFAAVGG